MEYLLLFNLATISLSLKEKLKFSAPDNDTHQIL